MEEEEDGALICWATTEKVITTCPFRVLFPSFRFCAVDSYNPLLVNTVDMFDPFRFAGSCVRFYSLPLLLLLLIPRTCQCPQLGNLLTWIAGSVGVELGQKINEKGACSGSIQLENGQVQNSVNNFAGQ